MCSSGRTTLGGAQSAGFEDFCPFVIGASASGPVIGGLGYDLTNSYSSVVLIFAVLAAIGAAAALAAHRPGPPRRHD